MTERLPIVRTFPRKAPQTLCIAIGSGSCFERLGMNHTSPILQKSLGVPRR